MSADTRTSVDLMTDHEVIEAVMTAAASIFPANAEWKAHGNGFTEAFVRAVYVNASGRKVTAFPATCSVAGTGHMNYVNARSIATLCQYAFRVAKLAEKAVELEALIASCADDLYGTLVAIKSLPDAESLKIYNVASDVERRLHGARASQSPPSSPSPEGARAVVESPLADSTAQSPEARTASVEHPSVSIPTVTDLSLQGESEITRGSSAHLKCVQTVNRFGLPLPENFDCAAASLLFDPHALPTDCHGSKGCCEHHEYLPASPRANASTDFCNLEPRRDGGGRLKSYAVVAIRHNSRQVARSESSVAEAVDRAIDLHIAENDLSTVSVIGHDGETWPEELITSPEGFLAREEIPSVVLARYFGNAA